MIHIDKLFMGYLSVVITFAGYSIYIASMCKKINDKERQIKPSPLSWALFGLLTGTGWLIQVAQGGNAGSWCLGVTAMFCFLIAGISFFKYDWTFAWDEWAGISVGIILFVFYLVTKTPTLSATLAASADFAGYYPIIKRGWRKPGTDNPVNFAFNSAKCIPALLALSAYSWATCVYLVMLLVVNACVAVMLLLRKKVLCGYAERQFKSPH